MHVAGSENQPNSEVRQTLSHLVERVKKFARTVAAQPKSKTRMKDRCGHLSSPPPIRSGCAPTRSETIFTPRKIKPLKEGSDGTPNDELVQPEPANGNAPGRVRPSGPDAANAADRSGRLSRVREILFG